ncbi:hypothetical protein E2C01_030780 [Portunus trituberculatus]|uniref:Uncharacterized protein n=1 Tax=Portunus trituberculatus TaxID=210409 RepID=A0A5B7EVU0_PORTR|nr:hypothetical protein [Portunus trituberculatus]
MFEEVTPCGTLLSVNDTLRPQRRTVSRYYFNKLSPDSQQINSNNMHFAQFQKWAIDGSTTAAGKLDITAKVEAGVKIHKVGRLYSINESTVCNMVKCKDVIKNTVQEASPHASCSAAVNDGATNPRPNSTFLLQAHRSATACKNDQFEGSYGEFLGVSFGVP